MKEEWLMSGAVVPVDVETTAALVAEIKRLIGVIGGMALAEQPAQPIRWDSNAVDMTGAMATLPKSGSESVVDYKPVISDVGADANIPAIPGTYYGIVLKGTGKITVTNGVQRKPWVGLTDEEKQIAFDDTQEGGGFWEFADAIEAKLREKNA